MYCLVSHVNMVLLYISLMFVKCTSRYVFIFLVRRTLIEKSAVDRLVLMVTVSQEDVQFHYGIQGGQTRSLRMKTAGHISIGHWTHVALQVGGLFLLSWPSRGHL